MIKKMLSIVVSATLVAGLIPINIVGVMAFETNAKIAFSDSECALFLKSDGTVWQEQENNSTQVSSLNNVIDVAAYDESYIAVKSDGSVWTWGSNGFGVITDGSEGYDESETPMKLNGLENVKAVAVGGTHALALKTDGTVVAWGDNDSGELGDGTFDSSVEPVTVKNLKNVVFVAAKDCGSAAITSDGSVWTWGDIPTGNGENSESNNFPTKVSSLTSVKKIVLPSITESVVVLKSDGTVWSWGQNTYGMFGNGTTDDSDTPVKMDGISDAVDIMSEAMGGTYVLSADKSVRFAGTDGLTVIEGGKVSSVLPIIYYRSDSNELSDFSSNADDEITKFGSESTVLTKSGKVYLISGTETKSNTMSLNAEEIFDFGSTVDSNESDENIVKEKTGNIYDSMEETDLSFDSETLEKVFDAASAEKLFSSTVKGMTSEEKSSVKAKDQLAYLAEEAASRASSIECKGDIVINDDTVSQSLSSVLSTKSALTKNISDNDVKVRSVRSKVKFVSNNSERVSVKKESIQEKVDVLEAVTPFAAVEFEPAVVSNLTVENSGTNKISVNFDSLDTDKKVTVKFPGISSDGFKAVVDENGNVMGGKYNPITDELSAKISEGGVFSVVTNEKHFSDIKDNASEVQNAINKLAAKGIIKGTSETEFSPDSSITRAEVAALIVRILGVEDPNADGEFDDVTKENWYFGAAGSSKRENIIAGYEDNTFRGKVVIPKVQITSVIARTLHEKCGYDYANTSVLNEYTDLSSIPQWSKNDLALATYSNMVIKRTDGSFEPNTEMTRGDAALVLEKLFDKVW